MTLLFFKNKNKRMADNNITSAGKLLGISRQSLQYKLKKYQLE